MALIGEVAPARGPRRAGAASTTGSAPGSGRRPRGGWWRGRAAGRRRARWPCRSARARASSPPSALGERARHRAGVALHRHVEVHGLRAAQQVAYRPAHQVRGREPLERGQQLAPCPARGARARAGLPGVDRRHRRTGMPAAPHALLGLAHAVAAVVEDRGAQHRVGSAPLHRLHEVVERRPRPRRDHRHVDGVGDRARQLQLVAVLGAVAVHAREQDLPAPRSTPSRAQSTRVASRRRAAAVHVHAVAAAVVPAPRVDGQHHALGAEHRGQLAQQLGPRHGGGVDRHLVGAGVEHRLGVLDRAHPAADGEGDEDVVGAAARQLRPRSRASRERR